MRRSLTRSLTRSPTPIKYDYDIYKKRSPTFGRRCPVLNRRPRNTVKSETGNRSKSSVNAAASSTVTGNRQDNLSSGRSTSSSIVNDTTNDKNIVKQKSGHEAGKSVSSRISSSINTVSGSSSSKSGGRSIGSSWDNPSYFQHDNRESQSTSGSGCSGGSIGSGGGGKKVSRKRKPRQSPFRWQHDLFEDDRSPSVNVESRTSQRKKEAKMSEKL